MIIEAADKMKNFEAGIFNILDDKKKELEKQGRKIYNFSVGTPDFETEEHIMRTVAEACLQTRTLIEVNNSSLSPHSSRSGGWENMRSMLQHCAELKVPVLFGSDAHFCEQIGRFDLCRQLCAEVGFPGELIVNDQPERIQEFFGLMIR